MDIEVLVRYAGARLLKTSGVQTPSLVQTLDLPVHPTFSFKDGSDIVLPKPSPATPLEERYTDSNTLHVPLDNGIPIEVPSTDMVYLHGAEGVFRSQSGSAKLLVETRESLRADQMLFVPMLSLPHRYALYSLAGIDLFDSAPIVEATRAGMMLSPEGWTHISKVKENVPEDLLLHNTNVALRELATVRQSLRDGNLRILAEARSTYDPWASSLLRILDRDHYDYMERNTPVQGPRLPVTQSHALYWPEVRRYQERFEERYTRPEMADVLLLIPCSASKPYSLSASHRKIHDVVWDYGMATRVHEVIVTSPMGIIPRELETYYPNMQYDTAVTGDWSAEEREIIQKMLEKIRTQSYEHILIHLPDSYLSTVNMEGTVTTSGRTVSNESLRSLGRALRDIGGHRSKVDAKERLRQDMISRLVYQFGPAGAKLADGAEIRGRYPDQKILVDGVQRGMLTKEKGQVSLTLEGGEILAREGVYCVEIEDFKPKGDIFAIGVSDASAEIRIGDDVVVTYDGEVRAVGVANMTPEGMKSSRKGVAVRTRSHV